MRTIYTTSGDVTAGVSVETMLTKGSPDKHRGVDWGVSRRLSVWSGSVGRVSTGKDMEAATAAGAAQYADVLHALNAAGLPTGFTQTGGMCAALEVQLENGRTLLITDFEDSLSWHRADHCGWSVGLYPSGSEYDDGPLVFKDSEDGSMSALFPLIKSVMTVRQATKQHNFGGLE